FFCFLATAFISFALLTSRAFLIFLFRCR
ncbi:helix-turn-helix domain protein, partial [Chlamydia psittaci 84-8471/1]